MNTKILPLDFAALRKGTWLEAEQLEEATRCRRGDPDFHLAVLGLRELIEARTRILAREDGPRLRLMTDGEANVWCIKQAGIATRRLRRASERLQDNIDVAALTPEEQVVHEHATRVISEMARSQMESVRQNAKLFALLGNNRSLPQGDDESED